MQPNHFDIIVWDAIVAERQARIKADVRALRGETGASPHRPGAIRRRLGRSLIALGHHLTEPVDATGSVSAQTVQPAFGSAQR